MSVGCPTVVGMDSIEQYHAWQQQTIRRYGWALQAVHGEEDSPPFVYTVGLTGFGHPELILFATARPTAAAVLNDLGERVRAGRVLAAGERVRVRSGDVHLLDFPSAEHWLYAADDLSRAQGRGPVRALLVVPADDLVPAPGEDGPCRLCP
jgi:hypothetical protein